MENDITQNHSCRPGEFKMQEIFDFFFTQTRHMTNTFLNEKKCPSYNAAASQRSFLIEILH